MVTIMTTSGSQTTGLFRSLTRDSCHSTLLQIYAMELHCRLIFPYIYIYIYERLPVLRGLLQLHLMRNTFPHIFPTPKEWFYVFDRAPFLSPLATVMQCILSMFTICSVFKRPFCTDSDKASSFCSVD